MLEIYSGYKPPKNKEKEIRGKLYFFKLYTYVWPFHYISANHGSHNLGFVCSLQPF